MAFTEGGYFEPGDKSNNHRNSSVFFQVLFLDILVETKMKKIHEYIFNKEHFNATWSTLIGLGLAVRSSNHDQVLFHYLEFKYKSYCKIFKVYDSL